MFRMLSAPAVQCTNQPDDPQPGGIRFWNSADARQITNGRLIEIRRQQREIADVRHPAVVEITTKPATGLVEVGTNSREVTNIGHPVEVGVSHPSKADQRRRTV